MRWGVVPGSGEHLEELEPGAKVHDPVAGEKHRLERRRKWKQRLERYIIDCAYSGAAQEEHVGTLTAQLISSRLDPNLMITLTFPAQVGEDRRRFEVLGFLRKWLKSGRYAVAFERHRSGKLHAHAVAQEEGVRRLSMKDAWEVESGGWGRVELVQDRNAAVSYVAKYITKQDQGELEFGWGVSGGGDSERLAEGERGGYRPGGDAVDGADAGAPGAAVEEGP